MVPIGAKRALLTQRRRLQSVPGLMADPPTATWRGSGTTGISSAVTISKSSGKFRFLNAIATHASTYYVSSPSSGQAFVVDFVTSAAQVDIRLLRFNSQFNVFVDNAPISATKFVTDSAGSADILALDFTGTEKETSSKRIKLIGFNIQFNGVYLSAGADAAAPTTNRRIAAILGDSYTQGSGATSAGETWARYCFDALGYDIMPEGVGGTGYLTGAGTTAAATRMTDRIGVMPHAPNLIAVALGYNDAGGNMTTLATNCATTIAAARAAWPSARIVIIGPWTPLGTTTNLDLVRSTLITAAATAGVTFLDTLGIITAANSAAYGYGDNVHANVDGYAYIGHQLALRGLSLGLAA